MSYLFMPFAIAVGNNSTNVNSTSNTNNTSTLNPVTIAVISNPTTVYRGGQATLTVTVTDNSVSPSYPTGTVLWSDGSVGGTFTPSSCTLASGSCTTSYTPATNSTNSVTISTSYAGDLTHHGGSGSLQMTANTPRVTTTTITPNTSTVSTGGSLSFVVTVSDTTSLPIVPTGNMSWSDGSAGGIFTPLSCTLASGSCTVSYSPSQNSATAVTITSTYGGDSTHSASAGTSSLTVNVLHGTTVTLTQNLSTAPNGGTTSYVVKVNDTSSTKTTPTGTVSFTDGHAGGQFNTTSCTLSSGACGFSYTQDANPLNIITINATYSGDSSHTSSTTSSYLSTNTLHSSTTIVTPNPATLVTGGKNTFTATVSDLTNKSANIIGIISWSDNGAGGSFNPNNCILVANTCSLIYTPPSSPTSSITITASYVGDSEHSGSSGMSSLSTSVSSLSTSSQNASTSSGISIPSWVRNNAKWWSENTIGDGDFEKGIQYLIQQGVLKIPPTQAGISSASAVPSWVKNNAGWWANGQISDDEFIKGIQYLIEQGIIKD